MSDAAEWTKDQSNQITALYGRLKGEYNREAYQKLFGGSQLPYLDAFNTLNSIIERQEEERHVHGGLEAKTDAAPATTSQNSKYFIGGLGTLATALAAATSPLLGALALATTALTLYSTNRTEYAKAKK